MSKHICLSFGDPQTQYCLDCDQICECLEKKKVNDLKRESNKDG